ncbi:hypothetical protein PUF88_01705 [Lactobacillaceae bacterium L1_55_11]|nr:hypothetical protein [Lactobacillaceae bacterium L1_55_11]
MNFLNTTRWKNDDENITNVDEAIAKFLDKDGTEISSKQGSKKYSDIVVGKVFDDAENITILGKDVNYNAVSGHYLSTSPVTMNQHDVNFFVIVYEVDGRVYFIINRNTDALPILRSFLSIERRNKIVKYNVALDSNMLLYFVYRVFENDSTFTYIESNQEEIELVVKNLTGLKGSTETSNLSVDGSSISKLISTLSLLLEIKQLSELKMNIAMDKHPKINILLKKDGLIGVSVNDYAGNFDNRESPDQKRTDLFLHVYLFVLPIILSEYGEAIDSQSDGNEEKAWGRTQINKFLSEIKTQLESKIDEFEI